MAELTPITLYTIAILEVSNTFHQFLLVNRSILKLLHTMSEHALRPEFTVTRLEVPANLCFELRHLVQLRVFELVPWPRLTMFGAQSFWILGKGLVHL